MAPPRKPSFDIDASIVLQLGEDLIRDVVQALVELVKNCYDADASYARIEVDTKASVPEQSSFFPDATGYILVADDGVGMDEDAINDGWLTVSNSLKREMKRRKRTTKKGRTPLGDKGLGRLGVQRLGHNVEIYTRPRGAKVIHHVGWCWRQFDGQKKLSTISPRWLDLPAEKWQGTKLVVSDLREPNSWEGANEFAKFLVNLSRMISPYEQFRDFTIAGSVNGRDIELSQMAGRVRDLSQLRYKVDFDENRICFVGRAALSFLRPSSRKDMTAFQDLVLTDNGKGFFEFLQEQPKAAALGLRRHKGPKWFAYFRYDRDLENVPGVELKGKKPASPGPFHAEVDSFDLGKQAFEGQHVFDRVSSYRDHIKDLSGVGIFRDGFRIRVDEDWLKLGPQWTGGGSYYGLKPGNTLGYVALTAKDNADLVETADREGFKDSPEHRNFCFIFEEFVKFTHDAQEFLRRSWIDFRNAHEQEHAHVAEDMSPEQVAEQLTTGIRSAAKAVASLTDASKGLDDAQQETEEHLGELEDRAAHSDHALAAEIADSRKHLQKMIEGLRQAVNEAVQKVDEIHRLGDLSAVLQQQLATLQQQLGDMYETVSLGLTAEALSHEIANIADQMTGRVREIRRHLARSHVDDAKTLAFVEYMHSSIAALRKQLSHLAPSLKYVREHRKQIPLDQFLIDLREYHAARWKKVPISIALRGEKGFVVSFNEGKLLQIFDNLILNSDYWLREDLRKGRIENGQITISVAPPCVRVSDNGHGVELSVEGILFEPFVTCKGRGKGRGLGLFIVRQLLDSEGCTVSLLSTRNQFGRLYRFEIDFSGAVKDD